MALETNLRQATAKAYVTGVVSDKKLKVEHNDKKEEIIKGSITIKTSETNFVTFNINICEKTTKGADNKAYAGIKTVMNDYKSIADVGEENADRVRVSGDFNIYNSINGNDVVSYKSNFFHRLGVDEEYTPSSEFEIEMFISSIRPEVNKEGEETGRIIVGGWIPTYNNGIEPIELVAENEVASAIDNTFEVGQTATFYGEIINNRVEKITEIPVVIGKPKIKREVTFKNDLLITGATEAYEEGVSLNAPYNQDTIKAAIEERKNRIAERNAKNQSPKTTSKPSGKTHGRTLNF